jgi:hypothetical protein
MLVSNPGRGWEPEALDTCQLLYNYEFDSGVESRHGVQAGGFRYVSLLCNSWFDAGFESREEVGAGGSRYMSPSV